MPFWEKPDQERWNPSWLQPSPGAPSDMSDVYELSARTTRYNESTFGHADLLQQEYEVADEMNKSLGAGDAPVVTSKLAYSMLARDLEGLPFDETSFADYEREQYRALKDYNDKLSKIKSSGTSAMDGNDLWRRAKKQAESLNLADIRESSAGGFATTVAQFAGSMAGYASSALTLNDPTIIFQGLGGFGKTAIGRVATEAGVQGGVELANQFTGVALNKKLLGIEHTTADKFYNAAAVAAFGGITRGAVEYGGPTYRALEMKYAPNRVFKRDLEARLMAAEESVKTVPVNEFTDYLRYGTDATKIADARASDLAIESVANQRFADAVRVYGVSDSAAAHARGLLRDGYSILDGERMKTDTAVARVFYGDDAPKIDIADLSAESEKLVIEAARRENPDVFARLDEANKAVAEIDREVAARKSELENLSLADYINEFDPDTAARIRLIESELEQVIPTSRRAALEQELNMITKGMDEEAIAAGAKAVTSRIVDKAETFRRRTKQKTSIDKFNRAKKRAEDVINASRRGVSALAQASTPGSRPAGGAVSVPPAYKSSKDIYGDIVKGIESAERASTPAMTTAAINRAVPDVNGEMDFGAFKAKEGDKVAVSDGAGGFVVKTVRDVLDGISEEESVLAAMKGCSL